MVQNQPGDVCGGEKIDNFFATTYVPRLIFEY